MKTFDKILLTDKAHKPMFDFWKNQSVLFEEGFFLMNRQNKSESSLFPEMTFVMPQGTHESIQKLSGNNSNAAFVCMLTALGIVLRTYENNRKVVINTPLFKRNQTSDIQQNQTIPLAFVIDNERTIKDQLGIVQHTIKSSYEFQNFPVDFIRNEYNNDFGKSNLLFSFIGVHEEKNNDEFDLSIRADFSANQTEIIFRFKDGFITKNQLDAFVGHWSNVLQSFSDTTQVIKNIKLLSLEEEINVVESFNSRKENFFENESEATIISLFRKQVVQTPDKKAVIFNDNVLTYTELDEASNQLAKLLVDDYGLKKEDRVGIMMERSEWLIVSMIAIMKAGAAYIPIDPAYPEERKKYILADAAPKLLLTKSDYLFEIDYFGGNLFAIDLQFDFDRNTSHSAYALAEPQNLAYIIYTSGSTGNPKGVAIEHRSIANSLVYRKKYCNVCSEDVSLQLPSFSFDSSVLDIFTPLVSGATVVMLEESKKTDPVYLIEKIKKHGITTMIAVPSQYKALLYAFGEEMKGLRFVTVAGESTNNDLLELHFDTLPQTKLFNEYGPTENAVCSTIVELTRNQPITIGHPLANTAVYIIDDNQKALPVGVAGEIAVAGVGIARYYINRPELTATKFVENPFGSSEKMYLTGDIGRWTSEGNIEFLGRKDFQVKIRGFRIELEEVEAQLLSHDSVNLAVVQAREDATGAKYLSAYVTTNENIDTNILKEYLKGLLPEYMVPAYITCLDAFPLTPNQKIDRKVLPDPIAMNTNLLIEPTSPNEIMLAEIWGDVLGTTRIGIGSNFFDMGGDSIKAIQIAARIHKAGYRLEVKDIFKNPTLGEQAAFLENINLIEKKNTWGIVPITPNQYKSTLTNDYLTGTYVKVKVFVSTKEIDISKATKALRAVKQANEALNIIFRIENDKLIQECLEKIEDVSLENRGEVTDISVAVSDNLSQIANDSLIGKPLFWAEIYYDSRQEYIVFYAHQAIFDEESWGILLEDFTDCYSGSKDLVKKSSFKNWAEQVFLFSQGEEVQQEIGYWKKQAVKVEMAKWKAETKIASKPATVGFSMGRDVTNDILPKANKMFRTNTQQLLLVAYSMSLNDIFGINNESFELETSSKFAFHGDSDARGIGNFNSCYPVCLPYDATKKMTLQVKNIKELLNNVPHEGVGFEILEDFLVVSGEAASYRRANWGLTYMDYSSLKNYDFILEKNASLKLNTVHRKVSKKINIIVNQFEDTLECTILYDTESLSSETIELFKKRFEYNFLKIIVHCATQETEELSPSDFGQTDLSIEELEFINTIYE